MTRLSSSSPVTAATTSASASPTWPQAVDLAGVGHEPAARPRGSPSACIAGDPVGVDLDDLHLVAGLRELAGDERADVAAAGDDDLHA